MDCDTTGIEPDFALVKFKKLAGGGYFKIINRAVPEGLRSLGYGQREIDDIVTFAVGRATLKGAPAINHETLLAKGFTQAKLDELEATLAGAFDIKFVFNKWTLGAEFLSRCAEDPGRKTGGSELQPALPISAFRARKSTPPMFMSAAP